MSDREKVINDLQRQIEELEERLAIVLEGQPEIVRCKECEHNARCEIAFGCNDDREWYCANGERAE